MCARVRTESPPPPAQHPLSPPRCTDFLPTWRAALSPTGQTPFAYLLSCSKLAASLHSTTFIPCYPLLMIYRLVLLCVIVPLGLAVVHFPTLAWWRVIHLVNLWTPIQRLSSLISGCIDFFPYLVNISLATSLNRIDVPYTVFVRFDLKATICFLTKMKLYNCAFSLWLYNEVWFKRACVVSSICEDVWTSQEEKLMTASW